MAAAQVISVNVVGEDDARARHHDAHQFGPARLLVLINEQLHRCCRLQRQIRHIVDQADGEGRGLESGRLFKGDQNRLSVLCPRRHDRCGSREQDQGGLQWRQKSLAGQDVALGLCLEL